MDRTTRLIKMQRLTIVALLLGLIAVSVYARREIRFLRHELNEYVKNPLRDYEITKCGLALGTGGLVGVAGQTGQNDQKDGEIDPRRGESEYNVKQGLKPQIDR